MTRKWRPGVERARENLRENVPAYLTVHFFRRFFTGELTSTEGDLRLGIGGIIALLMLPGAFLPLLLLPKYSSFLRWLVGQRHFDFNAASIPDKYMLLTLTMVITGIVAILKWDGLFPDRLDYANLVHLPVKTTSIFSAKLLALALFVGLFVVALNAASTILFPLVVLGDQTSGTLFLHFILAHAVATVAGSIFSFCFFLALAGLLMTLLPYRWFRRISTAVQLISIISLVMLLFVQPQVGSHVANVAGRALPSFRWLPTVWFLGTYQTIFGATDPGFHALAVCSTDALATAVAASLLFYGTSYWRHFCRISEVAEPVLSGPGRTGQFVGRWFDRLALRSPFNRACFHFAGKTLARSQRHALLLAGFVGLGIAIAMQDVTTNWNAAPHSGAYLPSATVLSAPLAIVFFLLSGLAFVFGVPAELSANWIFQVAGEFAGGAAQPAARRLMLIFLAPVMIVTASVYSALWGLGIGIGHTAFLLAASLLLVEVLLVGYHKIPFACSYAAGKNNVGLVLATYFLAFFCFATGLAHLEHWALESKSSRLVALIGLAVASLLGLRRYANQLAGGECTLIFKDESEAVVASMDLR
jgi:hypothetical protein